MLFEGRDGGEGLGGEVAGAQVAEGGEFFAELEEALFGADRACAVFLFFLPNGRTSAGVRCVGCNSS